MNPFSMGSAGFMPFGGSGCTLCQSPGVQQFLFFTAIVAALYVWWTIIEE